MTAVPQPTEEEGELDPKRWRAVYACMATLFMTVLDFSMVAVALPSIGQSTGAHPAQLQWVVSGYALGFGLVPIVAGRLGDDRGRKKILLIGTAGFVITSAVIGFAPNAEVLVVTRFIQGLTGGLINPQVSGVAQTLLPRKERPRAFALLGGLVGVASAAGPVVGGIIIYLGGTEYGWRIAFLINVPIGVTAMIMCARWLPALPRRYPPRQLDLTGIGLLGLALFGVLFPAVEYDSNRDLRLAYILIPAAVLFAIFYWWEAGPARRRGYPLIDIALFRTRSYADGVLLGLLFFSTIAIAPLVLTLFLQDGLNYGALPAGMVASSAAIGFVLSALASARLLPRFGGRLLLAALGLLVVGLGVLLLVVWTAVGAVSVTAVGFLLLVPLALVGLGQGSVATPNQVLAFAEVDAEHASTAGGMLQSAQRVSMAIGTAAATAVFYAIALGGHPVSGRAQQVRYGHAYIGSLLVVAFLAVCSLLVAIRSLRHARAQAQDLL